MNATKKGATLILGVLLSASMVFAQAPDANPAPAANAPQVAPAQPGNFHRTIDPGQRAQHLGKRLGLTGGQVAQITPILADRQQQMQSLHADTTLSQQDRRAKARAIMQGSNSKIEALMNDTQKQQFEQMLAQRRSHRNRQTQPQA